MFIYPCFFIPGFVIVSYEGLQDRIRQMRWLSLGLGLVLSAAYLFLRFDSGLAFPLRAKMADTLLSFEFLVANQPPAFLVRDEAAGQAFSHPGPGG